MARIAYITNVDQAHAAMESVELTPPHAGANLPSGVARRDSLEGSAFWPELDPQTSELLRQAGAGADVDAAKKIAPELSLAINNGFPIPHALKARAVYEVYKVIVGKGVDRSDRLKALALMERMARSNVSPNALPNQLPASGPSANVQVNIQNNPSSAPSVSVVEMVDELLSRPDVQAAIEADLPHTQEDYGM